MAPINRKQIPLCKFHHVKHHSKGGLSPEDKLLMENNLFNTRAKPREAARSPTNNDNKLGEPNDGKLSR